MGVLLGLSRDELPALTNEAGWRALLTVRKWFDKDPLPLRDTFKILEEHLRAINLSSIIPRLRGRERYTVIGKSLIILSIQCLLHFRS